MADDDDRTTPAARALVVIARLVGTAGVLLGVAVIGVGGLATTEPGSGWSSGPSGWQIVAIGFVITVLGVGFIAATRRSTPPDE